MNPQQNNGPSSSDRLRALVAQWWGRGRVAAGAIWRWLDRFGLDFGSLRQWVFQNQRLCLIFLIVLALFMRVVMAERCVRWWGYIYDEYHEGVTLLYENGQLPESTDCWQCYHPPLFYLLGLPFYALGVAIRSQEVLEQSPLEPVRTLCWLSMVAAGFVIFYAYRIYRLFRLRGIYMVFAMGTTLVFPCLYISSWGVEADIVLTAVMVALLYYAIRYFLLDGDASWKQLIGLGVACGLAIATKYNGAAGLLTMGILVFLRFLRVRRWNLIYRDGPVILAVALLVGGWKYYDNYRKYETPLFANGTAAAGFGGGESSYHLDYYDFTSFRYRKLVEIMGVYAQPGDLTEIEPYPSVFTTLHGLAWSDMGFFTRGDRHGAPWDMYPWRPIPVWMPASVLALAVLPNLLCALGFFLTGYRRFLVPMTVLTVVTCVAYTHWFLSQDEWALKTKYILFLLPAYIVYAVLALRWMEKKVPRPFVQLTWGLLWVLLLLTHVYMFQFSWATTEW